MRGVGGRAGSAVRGEPAARRRVPRGGHRTRSRLAVARWDAVAAARRPGAGSVATIGFGDPADHVDELAVGKRLLEPDRRDAVVTPGDFCPDNVIFTGAGPRFVDLEGSSVHHLAMDAAYAATPFGTCWCLFDAPAGFTTGATRPDPRRGPAPACAVTQADGRAPRWPISAAAVSSSMCALIQSMDLRLCR